MDNYSQQHAWETVEEIANLNRARNLQLETYLRQVLQHRNLLWWGIIFTLAFGFSSCSQGLLLNFKINQITRQIASLEDQLVSNNDQDIRHQIESLEEKLSQQKYRENCKTFFGYTNCKREVN